MQPEVRSGDLDLAAHFARTLCGVATPDPIPFDHAAEMVRSGQLGGLMEEVVSMVETVQPDCDVVIVEGLIPDVDFQIATRLNIEIIRSLGADLIPVLAGGALDADGLAEKAAAAAEQYGDDGRRPIAGLLINRCADAAAATALTEVGALTLNGASTPVPILAAVPNAAHLRAPRLIDIAEDLGLKILNRGDIETSRVQALLVAARSPEKLLGHLRPGTVVITPADRSDAILVTALVAQRGMPLAGFVLTCGGRPAPEVSAILAAAPLDRLPILGTDDDTFTTASRLASLSAHVSRADGDRMERVISFIAEKVDTQPLAQRLNLPVEASDAAARFPAPPCRGRARGQPPDRAARGRRAAHDPRRGDLRREAHRPLHPARGARPDPRGRRGARHRPAATISRSSMRSSTAAAMSRRWWNFAKPRA